MGTGYEEGTANQENMYRESIKVNLHAKKDAKINKTE